MVSSSVAALMNSRELMMVLTQAAVQALLMPAVPAV
jgi:hypothetical protein